MRYRAGPYWSLFYIPGADTADEPVGTHQEAAAEGLPGGKGSSVTKWGSVLPSAVSDAWRHSLVCVGATGCSAANRSDHSEGLTRPWLCRLPSTVEIWR